MPSQNITALTDYAGGQSPADLVYVGKSPFGATDDRKSTLNDLISVITKNITDGALRFGQFAAPALSAANAGAIYFDNVSKTFQVSENGGAYVALKTLAAGSVNEIQYNGGAGAFAANAAYTYDSTTNTVNLGAAGLTGKLKLTHTNTRALTIQPGTMSAAKTFTWMTDYGNANQAVVTDGFGNLSYADFLPATLPGSDKQIFYNDSGSLNAAVGFEYSNAGFANVAITPTGYYTGLFINEPLGTGSSDVNGYAALICLNVINHSNYYAIGYKNDQTPIYVANYLADDGSLNFECSTSSANYATIILNAPTTALELYSYIPSIASNDMLYMQRYGAGLFSFFIGIDNVSDLAYFSRVTNTPQLSLNASGQVQLHPIGTGAGNTNELRFLELAANGTNYAAFKAADSLAASITWTLPNADGSSGQFLQTNGSGILSFATPSAALTAGQVGFGSAGNVLTGSTKLTWDDSTRVFSFVTGAANAQIYFNTSLSTANIKFQSSAGIPGSQAGLIFPYIGGDQTSGHGLWWSDGTYLNTSRFNLQLGFNFQGAASSTSPVKIRKATGTSADGNIIFAFFPDSGFFDLQPYGVSAGETSRIRFSELAANGTNYIEFRAPDALTANVTLAWPNGAGSANQVLTTNGSSALSWSNIGDVTITMADAANIITGTTTGSKIGTASNQKIGFWNASPVIQQSVAALTNNVTAGGSNDVIADYSDLTIYANDAAAIRNDIYQLARKLKETVDALRLYGIFA